jgi:hypothetical protein
VKRERETFRYPFEHLCGDRFGLSIANWCLASGFGNTANNELSGGSMYFLPDCFRPPGLFPFVLNAGFVDNASA